jgi:hypothetical protein
MVRMTKEIITLMVGREMVPETLENFGHLTRFMAREDFIKMSPMKYSYPTKWWEDGVKHTKTLLFDSHARTILGTHKPV